MKGKSVSFLVFCILTVEPSTDQTLKVFSPEDERAHVRAAQQDPTAFRPLYEAYHPLIFRFVYRRIDSEAVAADLTSQVFLKVILGLKRYRITEAPFSAWLYRIALNEVRQFFRQTTQVRKIAIDERLLEELQQEEHPEDYATQWQTKLVTAIDTLNLDEVNLLELRFFEQRPFREIGFILNISENYAKVKTYRLLDKLRRRMHLSELI